MSTPAVALGWEVWGLCESRDQDQPQWLLLFLMGSACIWKGMVDRRVGKALFAPQCQRDPGRLRGVFRPPPSCPVSRLSPALI
ncbi:hypothetical protein SKAU_G00176640 [Synaphobranchus kaupii]|uniref:Uncharacterized protein n=1 Tax=Synaphobranchus kaupii TaxID=118154 RepID=A0A9Q1IZ45_SYNKA|nr:hypothetical protein SKAU_G00176640 [Synaphobranchus kaupii]